MLNAETDKITADPEPTPITSADNSLPSKSITPPTVPPTSVSKATKSKNGKKLSVVAVIIAAIAILAGGSAAAYYGVVVPNKPENVLKKAVTNLPNQKKTKFDGKLSYESTDQNASIKAVNVTLTGSADADANAFSSAFEVTASGVKLPFELRLIDKNIYVKIADLSNLKGLVQSTSPVYASTFEALNKKLANQWLEIDETLLKQANAGCAVNTNFSVTKEDIDLLQKRYQEVPFTTVKSTSNDTVNNRAAIKYEIEINDNKGAEYFKGLQDLSFVKKIKECGSKNSKTTNITPPADNDVTPLTLWVDKGSRQIVKVAGKTTPKDEAKSKAKISFEVTMQYGQVSIVKPDGAKPLLEVLGDFSQLFGLGTTSTTPAVQPSASDGINQECLQAIQDYTNSGGTKPIPTCL